jgi:hypothetical protein
MRRTAAQLVAGTGKQEADLAQRAAVPAAARSTPCAGEHLLTSHPGEFVPVVLMRQRLAAAALHPALWCHRKLIGVRT